MGHIKFILATISIIALSGCASDSQGLLGAISEPEPAPLAQISSSIEDQAIGVDPLTPVVFSVTDGTLDSVKFTDQNGVPIPGSIAADKSQWKLDVPLAYSMGYNAEVTATNSENKSSSRIFKFASVLPGNYTMPYFGHGEATEVGIGQPVAIVFDEPIRNRRVAQESITITTTPPVKGAFYWISNQDLRWRPENFWKPGTKVDVQVNVYGKELGPGLWGEDNKSSSFTVGDEVIATVDDNTKIITVTKNGEVIKTMPTSMGKNSTPTPNGTYIVNERRAKMVMDSSTYGVAVNSANGYRTEVQYATRMSYSGIFVHGAPWSVGSQGYTNVSHGCLNVSVMNANWFYANTKLGDIVKVKNTVGPTLSGIDGLGDWNMPWAQWSAGNADDYYE